MLPSLDILIPRVAPQGVVAQAIAWAIQHGYDTTLESVLCGGIECTFSDTTEWLHVDHSEAGPAIGWRPVVALGMHANAKTILAEKMLAGLASRLAEYFDGVVSLDNVMEELDPADALFSTPGFTGSKSDIYASPTAVLSWMNHPKFHISR